MNLYSLIRSRFPTAPDTPFLVDRDGKELGYPALDEHTARLAARLTALGVAPGDRVAIQAEKSIDGLLLYLATLRPAPAPLPLTPAYPAPEISYFLKDSEPALFVGNPDRGDGARRSLTLPELVEGAAPGGFTDVPRAPDDLAAILYTSGTTGRS